MDGTTIEAPPAEHLYRPGCRRGVPLSRIPPGTAQPLSHFLFFQWTGVGTLPHWGVFSGTSACYWGNTPLPFYICLRERPGLRKIVALTPAGHIKRDLRLRKLSPLRTDASGRPQGAPLKDHGIQSAVYLQSASPPVGILCPACREVLFWYLPPPDGHVGPARTGIFGGHLYSGSFSPA